MAGPREPAGLTASAIVVDHVLCRREGTRRRAPSIRVAAGALVVFGSMIRAERVASILHDVFGYRFTEVAEITGRSPAACRQLATSAGRRVRASRAAAASPARRASLVRDFNRPGKPGTSAPSSVSSTRSQRDPPMAADAPTTPTTRPRRTRRRSHRPRPTCYARLERTGPKWRFQYISATRAPPPWTAVTLSNRVGRHRAARHGYRWADPAGRRHDDPVLPEAGARSAGRGWTTATIKFFGRSAVMAVVTRWCVQHRNAEATAVQGWISTLSASRSAMAR